MEAVFTDLTIARITIRPAPHNPLNHVHIPAEIGNKIRPVKTMIQVVHHEFPRQARGIPCTDIVVRPVAIVIVNLRGHVICVIRQVHHFANLFVRFVVGSAKIMIHGIAKHFPVSFRRSVIQQKGIRFEETKIHNDTLYSYLVGFHAKKLAVCEQPIYNYTIREGSVSRIVSDDRLLLRVSVFAQKNRFLQDNHIEFIDKMMIWPFKYCKEHHKDSVYKSCLAEAQKYGFDEKFIKNLLFKHKIRKLFQKIQRKAYKLLGIKKALKNLAYS